MEYIKRNINFYELNFILNEQDTNQKGFLTNTFNRCAKLNIEKSEHRILPLEDSFIYTNDIFFDGIRKTIKGKFIRVRMNAFPELINTKSDVIKDIIVDEEEGICETSHFHIDYNNYKLIIAIEFNQYGPKINDIKRYISALWLQENIMCNCEFIPIVKDNLAEFLGRMNRCSHFKVKVHKDYINQIRNVDEGLFSALESTNNFASGESDYIEIFLKFEYRSKAKTSITDKAVDIIRKIISRPDYANYFDELEFVSEDSNKNNRLQLFDLISDKVKSSVNVQKREKSRLVVSADMYEKLEIELNNKFR